MLEQEKVFIKIKEMSEEELERKRDEMVTEFREKMKVHNESCKKEEVKCQKKQWGDKNDNRSITR